MSELHRRWSVALLRFHESELWNSLPLGRSPERAFRVTFRVAPSSKNPRMSIHLLHVRRSADTRLYWGVASVGVRSESVGVYFSIVSTKNTSAATPACALVGPALAQTLFGGKNDRDRRHAAARLLELLDELLGPPPLSAWRVLFEPSRRPRRTKSESEERRATSRSMCAPSSREVDSEQAVAGWTPPNSHFRCAR